ncbi:hypothetical protein [Aquabacterium sp.]|uniref:hypothetical protein n=1 Tax=Aquabacterium sp. TaxID=1872578 RepID=UPI0035C6A9E8
MTRHHAYRPDSPVPSTPPLMGMALLVSAHDTEAAPDMVGPQGDRRPLLPHCLETWSRWQLTAARAVSSLLTRDEG